jgi:hypothetical protein
MPIARSRRAGGLVLPPGIQREIASIDMYGLPW